MESIAPGLSSEHELDRPKSSEKNRTHAKNKKFWEELIRLLSLHKSFISSTWK
jgi:hypothetical protein